MLLIAYRPFHVQKNEVNSTIFFKKTVHLKKMILEFAT